jgi:serine/threonine-protein kinase
MLAGKYRIERAIGMGGMGMVYRAEHVTLRRAVAIKVLHNELAIDAHHRARFEREARAAAALSGPSCVAVIDVDRQANGTPYIVMELVEGETLHEIVDRDGPMPFPEVVRCAKQIASALAEAHAHGIVHRDLKPANVMRTTSGAIKVLDFGLALGLPSGPLSRSTVNSAQRLVGSPLYMAPEQIVSASDVDGRADIWALGATIFHLLTGKPPFMASNLYLLTARILGEDAPDVRERREGVPPILAAVVARCLAREPADRLATMTEVVDALEGRKALEILPPTRPHPHAPIGARPTADDGDTAKVDPYTAVTETLNPGKGNH